MKQFGMVLASIVIQATAVESDGPFGGAYKSTNQNIVDIEP